MHRLIAFVLVVMVVVWGTTALAAEYSALDGTSWEGPNVGVGGLLLSGDGPGGDSDSEFIPTINVSGLCDYVSWQAFYGFGSDASVFGGTVDYVFANNFDECETCPTGGVWWLGAGATLMSYSDLFVTGTTGGLDETEIGANIGGGWRSGDWGVDLYVHYLPSNEVLGFQGAVTYNFSN
ncbi:hypothetical protein IT575_02570 [bacterium]|nr:hypothetical protein [bacterium]